MSVRTAILGYLFEKECHGYELKKKIEHEMKGWADIKFGSIYFALRSLQSEKLVKKVRSEKNSGKPSRTIYRITKAGRMELRRHLSEILVHPKRIYNPYLIGVFFGKHLEPDEFLGYLKKHLTEIEQTLSMLKDLRNTLKSKGNHPDVALLLASNGLRHLNAERKWIREIIDQAGKKDIFLQPDSNCEGEEH